MFFSERKLSFSMTFLSLMAISIDSHATPPLRRLSWSKAPEKIYYDGYYLDHGIVKRFRTSSEWILVPLGADTDVKIYAIGQNGHSLGDISYTSDWVSSPQKTDISAPNSSELANPSPQEEDGTQLSQDQEMEGKTYDDALLFLDVDDPYASPQLKKRAEKSLIPYQRPERRDVALSVGLGFEKVSSSAGLSFYTGASNIGSSQFQGSYLNTSGWYASLGGEAHYFETVATKVVSEEEKKNENFERLGLDLRVGYEAAGKPKLFIVPHIGVYYAKLPVLVDIDQNTSLASFKSRSFKTLGLGIKAEGEVYSHHELGGSFFGFPLMARSSVDGYIAEVFYRYRLSEPWTLSLGFQWSLHQAVIKVNCPEIEECQDSSRTTINTRLWTSGLGYRW